MKDQQPLNGFQINSSLEPPVYNHQSIECIETGVNNINYGVLPTEVHPGVEFFHEKSKVYFSCKNEGKYISVVPDQKPLLAKDIVKE